MDDHNLTVLKNDERTGIVNSKFYPRRCKTSLIGQIAGLSVLRSSVRFGQKLSLCAASRMWVRHRSVVIVPPEGGLEFRWDSEMCWCFIHVTIKLVSGTTQRSVIESCITSPRETARGARQAEGL